MQSSAHIFVVKRQYILRRAKAYLGVDCPLRFGVQETYFVETLVKGPGNVQNVLSELFEETLTGPSELALFGFAQEPETQKILVALAHRPVKD